jgi:hypothetical protein
LKKDETAMTRHYNAFLIRHWSLDAEKGQRIEVQHVARGKHTLVGSLAAALAWMQVEIASEAIKPPSRLPGGLFESSGGTKLSGAE